MDRLALPVSFGCYGLLRKKMKADSITGLTVEMGLLLPIMLVIEIWLATTTGVAFLNAGVRTDLLLLLGGVVTAVPLVLSRPRRGGSDSRRSDFSSISHRPASSSSRSRCSANRSIRSGSGRSP